MEFLTQPLGNTAGLAVADGMAVDVDDGHDDLGSLGHESIGCVIGLVRREIALFQR